MANKADETLTQIESQMNTLKEKASTSLESTSAKAREQIENLRTRAEKALTDTHSQATNRLTALIVQCTSILTNIQTTSKEAEKLHREQREEYGRFQAEAGKYAAEIHLASTLFAFKTDPEALRLIGKDEINLRLNRIRDWSKLKFGPNLPTLQGNSFQDYINAALQTLTTAEK